MALRSGFTTGSAAAAAAMAAIRFALTDRVPAFVRTPLPPFANGEPSGWLDIPVERAGAVDSGFFGEVRKDGGDDPDITNGMIIRAEVLRLAEKKIVVDGGEGIGRVTLPGLAVKAGEAAINPAPRQQIEFGANYAGPNSGWRIIVSAPEGQKRAAATMNARLGIVGGISILGTHGLVLPFSHEAYRASVGSGLKVAAACGAKTVCLATGRRSAKLMERLYPDLPKAAFIIAGDFVKESLELAANFEKIAWGCFFGKLIKLAQGEANTHAHVCGLDMRFAAELARMPELAGLNTARLALEAILARSALGPIMDAARLSAERFAGRKIEIHLFHQDGRELARA